ncbi:hypothetical protein [Desulfitobacterium metallireducens]|uniref:Uncharacterized protein n=1 Tax=Desulfitobacterium metallireducens DSM 15288 TaxID=871968 RepID=W0ED58_9FIRM|nr:hypothetical protein [Desulfitobacterium metallireducens]AHF08672.1 hypothetical protein DESME_14090 [Desulfitobacterium metallireducens DSM 15288]
MKKKKKQLVGGILLMVLGLGVCAGSVAFRYVEHGGMGAFAGHRITNRQGMNGNYGFRNPQQRGFNQNPNFNNKNKNNNQNQAPAPSTPTPNQTPNQ